jgi:hypothetical protein
MNDRPCPVCKGSNIRFELTATENGFAIKAECKDCGQEFVIRHRDAVRAMWNEGYFEEVTE